MGKKKGGGDGGQAAITAAQTNAVNAQIDAQNRATNALIEGRNQGYQFLNQGQTQALQDINPLIPSARYITQNAANNIGNFDVLAGNLANEADAAYLAPAQRSIAEQVKNLFSSYGVGGGNNSRAQNAFARYGDEVAANEAMRRWQLRNETRNQFLNENQSLMNFGMQPIQMRSGINQDFAKSRANTAIGAGSQLGSTYQQTGQGMASTYQQGGQALAGAQQQAQQNRRQGKGDTASLIGTGVGAVTSLAGAFSDERLKENMKPVGRLDNGLNVYVYNFKGSNVPQIGLLAQEVQKVKPEAVHKDKATGYLKVEYNKAVAA